MGKKVHPSYGKISFNRNYNGAAVPLFGSSITHRNTISLRIEAASVSREVGTDFYGSEGLIVEVEMSQSQFAEAITSIGTSGVPCTLRYANGERIERGPIESVRQQLEQEFSQEFDEMRERHEQFGNLLKDILGGNKNVGKGDRERILREFDILRSKNTNNPQFYMKQFNAQMDKTVAEAKGEVEAFYEKRKNDILQAAALGQSVEVPVELTMGEEEK